MASKIQGLAKLNRKMRAIPEEAKRAAKKAVEDSAYELGNLQYSLAPVDEGDLRNSIEVTGPGKTTPPYSQPGGQRTAGEFEAIVTAGNTKVRYAHLVEFGTAQHVNSGKFAGTQNPGAQAQPFFWPAYRALRRRLSSRISRAISNAINQSAESGGSAP